MSIKIKVDDRLAVDPIFYDDKIIIVCNDPDSGLYVGWRSGRSCKGSTVLANLRRRLRVYDTDLVIKHPQSGLIRAKDASTFMWLESMLWPSGTVRKVTVYCFPCAVNFVHGMDVQTQIWLNDLDKE